MLLTRKERCTISPNKQQKLGGVFSARFVTSQGIFAGGRSVIRPRSIPAPLYTYIMDVLQKHKIKNIDNAMENRKTKRQAMIDKVKHNKTKH
jgi:hypothetical protein